MTRNKNCVWVRVWNFPPLQANFALEEELFKQKQVKRTKENDNKKAKQEVTFLDSKQSLNINIFLRHFKIPVDGVVKAVGDCDIKCFGSEELKSLLKFVPDKAMVS